MKIRITLLNLLIMMKKLTSATTFLGALALVGALSLTALNATCEAAAPPDGTTSQKEVAGNTSPAIVAVTTSADQPLTNSADCAVAVESGSVIAAVAKCVEVAKRDYSPRYGSQTGAIREQLVEKLVEYVNYSEAPGRDDAKALVKKHQFPILINLAEESPSLFRSRLPAVVEALSDYAMRSPGKNVEREKRLAVLMSYYLAVFEASDSKTLTEDGALETQDESVSESVDDEQTEEISEEEIELERQENFNYYCDELLEAVSAYFTGEGDSSIDEISAALGEMRYYQAESPAVTRLTEYLHSILCGQNFYLEASERFLTAFTYNDVDESFLVNEYIRGTLANGNGNLRGYTRVDVQPNENRAQMSISLIANVSTRTIGDNRGVFVHTDNLGSVNAIKPMYLNPDGLISTRAAVANANMKSTVRGISTNRVALLGGAIIQNKVSQELPFSERDGAERMKARVARQLDEQANAQILEMNRRVERMEIGSATSMIQKLKSRTSADRLYLSCVLGRGLQFSVPKTEFDAKLSELRRQNSVEEFQSGYASAKTSEPSTQHYIDPHYRTYYAPAFTPPAPRRVDNSAITTNSTAASPRFEPFRPIRNALSRNQSPETPEHDLVVRFHQSAPNNAATIALTGALFGPGYDTIDDVILRFPGVDPADIKKALVPYEPQGQRDLDPDDHVQRVFIRFDEVQPFSMRFEDGAVTTLLRLSSCDVDGTEWGPVEVRMVYRLEERGDKFAFVREELEVLPRGYQEGDPVYARFHTFRRIFIKRLEATINDEYVIEPLPVDTVASTHNRGSLVPVNIEIEDGWIRAEFDLHPNEDKGEGESDQVAVAR